MKDEITRIIDMVQEGKLTSDEGSELISALKDEPETPKTSSKHYLDKMVKIRVKSDSENNNIRVNIPIRLVKFLLKAGHGIASHIPEAKSYVEDLDVDLIMEAIDDEMEGKIVDVKSENGDAVEVYIE